MIPGRFLKRAYAERLATAVIERGDHREIELLTLQCVSRADAYLEYAEHERAQEMESLSLADYFKDNSRDDREGPARNGHDKDWERD
jgi:hypothetical protein